MARKEFESFTRLDASDVNEFLVNNGYQILETLYLTSSTTFTKATYPLLRAIKVTAIGAGGGGAGAPTTGAGQVAFGGGGGGGGAAESFILANDLGASETVTIGAGGAGGAAGQNNGSAGGSTSFGTVCSADGGGFGSSMAAASVPVAGGANGGGGEATVGDLLIRGGDGGRTVGFSAAVNYIRSPGGPSGKFTQANVFLTSTGNGVTGKNPGSGGGGSGNLQNVATARSGADGENGLVILELYA
jgi:hypothetical protein